jgi:hypothetical protein
MVKFGKKENTEEILTDGEILELIEKELDEWNIGKLTDRELIDKIFDIYNKYFHG